ncbi:MAG: hypothetical protein JW798_13055, partial [Prolixibacteraceae bacterium]|nr:hypothetical protein [Prolixibacteraceae bacterium]
MQQHFPEESKITLRQTGVILIITEQKYEKKCKFRMGAKVLRVEKIIKDYEINDLFTFDFSSWGLGKQIIFSNTE